MPIFSNRDDWKNLLARLDDASLRHLSERYGLLIGRLEYRIPFTRPDQRRTVESTLASYQAEMHDVDEEMRRRAV